MIFYWKPWIIGAQLSSIIIKLWVPVASPMYILPLSCSRVEGSVAWCAFFFFKIRWKSFRGEVSFLAFTSLIVFRAFSTGLSTPDR